MFESSVYRDLFGTPAMRTVFSDRAMVQKWLDVEVALAKSQAELGMIPASSAQAIAEVAKLENIDFDKLRAKTNKVGRGVNPLLGQLRKKGGKAVSEYLHFGSTTQDIMDTATVLQIKEGTALIRQELISLMQQLADKADQHKATVMLARSNGQDAVPTTFGLHLSTYMMELYRHLERLDEASSRLQAQIGSTVGTLAPYGDKGIQLQESVADRLGLQLPIAPWNPSRDVFAEMVQTLALIDATLGRVAIDVNNLSRTQIDELKEGEGGASSTMPQKRNPRASEFMGGFSRMGKMYNSAALDMMSHSDTRQGSPWILEWSVIPESFMVTSASIERAQRLFDKLIVKPDNMKRNFDTANRFAMSEAVMNALAAKIGRGEAYKIVKKAIKGSAPGDTLAMVIDKTPAIKQHLDQASIESLLQPENYVGSAQHIVERSVKKVRGVN
ncbi:class-II fumarase/aspartase family protein [Motiliproteus coralliicola]|uniref:class-II fumarase/aspartase family protein n=1 Tax=Motiliproteus coralliicola TaxID=2283196 RepID=UPI0014029625|nr:adenylosuccinate lyase family protein [Motiliproteus coralliicola]